MARKNEDEDDEREGESSEQLVPRELSDDEKNARRIELANSTVELLDREEKRTQATKKANDKIRELKGKIRKLAEQVRTGVEMVPAQLKLEDAIASRNAQVRSLPDPRKPVAPARRPPGMNGGGAGAHAEP